LKAAKESGIRTVMRGDRCDGPHAGYSFLFGLEKEKLELKLGSVMRFSSIQLAKVLGMEARLPLLDPDFKAFAMKINKLAI